MSEKPALVKKESSPLEVSGPVADWQQAIERETLEKFPASRIIKIIDSFLDAEDIMIDRQGQEHSKPDWTTRRDGVKLVLEMMGMRGKNGKDVEDIPGKLGPIKSITINVIHADGKKEPKNANPGVIQVEADPLPDVQR